MKINGKKEKTLLDFRGAWKDQLNWMKYLNELWESEISTIKIKRW